MVFEKVRAMVAKQLNFDETKITLETHLIDDLGADSLDAVDLIMSIEDEFGIEIDDDPDADNEFKWTSASASNLRNIEEVFFEISIDRSIMDKDLFHIAQILIKAELATIIEYHIDE